MIHSSNLGLSGFYVFLTFDLIGKQMKLRWYGSKCVVKYPRCSLRRQSAYADAEVIDFDFMSKCFALPSCCYKSPIKTHVMVHEYCSKIREEKGKQSQTMF